MLAPTMLSLTRSITLRVPLVVFKSTVPITLQRSPFLSSLSTYRALTTSSPLFAAAATNISASHTAGRSKAQPKTTAKAKPKPKAKVKSKSKATAKPKRKTAAKPKPKPKPKVSTRVPLLLRPPPRPPSAFVIFFNRVYPSPGSKIGGITSASKEAGEAWRNLPDLEKQAFQDEAKILFANYTIQRDKWYKKPENHQVLKTLNKDRKKRGKQRIHGPRTGASKRPMPAFMRFFQELRETNKLTAGHAPEGTLLPQLWAARESGAKWNALPASEKDKYVKAYHTDFAKWKATNATATA